MTDHFFKLKNILESDEIHDLEEVCADAKPVLGFVDHAYLLKTGALGLVPSWLEPQGSEGFFLVSPYDTEENVRASVRSFLGNDADVVLIPQIVYGIGKIKNPVWAIAIRRPTWRTVRFLDYLLSSLQGVCMEDIEMMLPGANARFEVQSSSDTTGMRLHSIFHNGKKIERHPAKPDETFGSMDLPAGVTGAVCAACGGDDADIMIPVTDEARPTRVGSSLFSHLECVHTDCREELNNAISAKCMVCEESPIGGWSSLSDLRDEFGIFEYQNNGLCAACEHMSSKSDS